MAKKRINPVDLPLKSKKKLSKSTGITSPKKSAPKSTRSKKTFKGSGKFIEGKAKLARKSPPPTPDKFKKHPKGSAEDKAAATRRKLSAKAKAKVKAKAKAAREAKIKKRGPIKQPKRRNPRKKGS